MRIRSILVVEDDSEVFDLLVWLLADAGYRTFCANNGRDALEQLRDNRVDLVITDVMMPIMDGLKLVKEIRSDRSLASIPVLIQSCVPEAQVRACGERIDGYVAKPFKKSALLRAVAALLSPKEDSKSIERSSNPLRKGEIDPGASAP